MPDDCPGGRGTLRALGMNLAAIVWGFGEATLFFLVPDVLLSWIALHRARAACVACGWALAGALIGGTLMYVWGCVSLATALAALDGVPAISKAMCDAVGEQVRTQGVTSLFVGPITGTPYKIYAVQAGTEQINLALFLLVSGLARLIRFALITGATIAACRLLAGIKSLGRRMIHLFLWTVFYAWYFMAVG